MNVDEVKPGENLRCGMVSIIGRPNVGKSTLLNTILGEKVTIVSKVPQTTRHQIRGIYNEKRGQIIFIDTPGLHLGKDKLDKLMNKSSVGTIDGADCIIHLVDTSRKIGEEERNVFEKLKSTAAPIILGLNKVDLKGKYLSDYISFLEEVRGQKVSEMKSLTLVALSARNGTNVDKLLDVIFECLPESPPLYPNDTICDTPQKMAIADIIREKFFNIIREEIPHSLGVVVESMQSRPPKIVIIKALVLVERDSQKEIVIGKKGQVLKKVGSQARLELEELLETKVFLELYVKTQKHWRDNLSTLQEFGYDF